MNGNHIILSATELIAIFETNAFRKPSSGQVAVFKGHINMTTAVILDTNKNCIQLYFFSRIKAATEANKSQLRNAFCAEGKEGFVWLQSMGSIVLAVSLEIIGIDVPDEDLEAHLVWPGKDDGVSLTTFSYKKGKEPTVSQNWIHDGLVELPKGIEYGVVDGAV